MPSDPSEPQSAESRFRQAFERLKNGRPKVLPKGTPVSQNNVAQEAGRDSTALKKRRFPKLVAEIQDYLREQEEGEASATADKVDQKRAKRTAEERMEDAIRQRDQAQSILASANVRIVELTEQVRSLQRQLDEIQPPPTRLGRR